MKCPCCKQDVTIDQLTQRARHYQTMFEVVSKAILNEPPSKDDPAFLNWKPKRKYRKRRKQPKTK